MIPIRSIPWRRFIAFLGVHDTRGYLLGQYGRVSGRDLSPDAMAAVKRGALFTYGDWESGIDDQTWSDLNMDAIYMRIEQSQSQAGKHSLYAMLRNTNISPGDLSHRGELIDWAARDAAGREELKRWLYSVGNPLRVDLPDMFEQCRYRANKQRLHAGMGLLALVLLLFTLLGVPFAPVLLALSLTVNLCLAIREYMHLSGYFETMSYIIGVLGIARAIAVRREPEFGDFAARLNEPLRRLRGLDNGFIHMHNTIANAPLGDVLMTIVGFFFLVESIQFQGMLRVLERQRPALIQALRAVGEVDACIAVASFRASLPAFCVPTLYTRSEPMLDVRNAVHPLLAHGVPNSIELKSSILITGSNATGKSTFLRTIAINAILAQTLITCTAEAWTSSFFRIETSMANRDDLAGGSSLFVSEMRSLKRMIDHVDPALPGLLIIDEILRGTNTHERIAASGALLMHLARQNCLCLAATHDLELTNILANKYINYHFEELVTSEGMAFDYTLRDGPTRTRNALALLRQTGYPEDLMNTADRSLDAFRDTGDWPTL